MFKKIAFQFIAAFLLLVASFGLAMPTNVYAQASGSQPQSAQYAGKCEKIKDKQKKKECEKQGKNGNKKKNDDGPNHDASDDHGKHGAGHD